MAGIKELTDQEIKDEMIAIWTELGRDPSKINFDGKSRERLEDGLEKLRAIQMGFKLLFKKDGNHALAVHLLSRVFLDEEYEEPTKKS